jgi:hypothetical protein
MTLASIPPGLDAALLAHANLSVQDISKLQASGSKLNAEKLDAVLIDRGLQIHERIAVKNMLRRQGVL